MTDTIRLVVELDADTVAALGICQHIAGDAGGAHAEAAAMVERTLVNETVRRAERLGLDPATWPRSPVLVEYPAGEPSEPDLRVRIRAGHGAEEVDGTPVISLVGWLVTDGDTWGGRARVELPSALAHLPDHQDADAAGNVRLDPTGRLFQALDRDAERILRRVRRQTGNDDLTRAALDWRIVVGEVTTDTLGIVAEGD
jgi:hypothetical protein